MSTVYALRASGVDYHTALDWQHAAAAAVRGGAPESIALIEHSPVYTMGARGGRATVLAPLEALPAPLVDTDRGGDITWHGPGQLVAYPILHLRDREIRPADYIRRLEAVLIDTLASFGIEGGAIAGRPGVWVGNAKVAAIGVRIQHGVSRHGIALNVAPDLGWFGAIIPCGIMGAGVTSIARELDGVASVPDMDAVIEAFRAAFEDHFGVALQDSDPSPLLGPPERPPDTAGHPPSHPGRSASGGIGGEERATSLAASRRGNAREAP